MWAHHRGPCEVPRRCSSRSSSGGGSNSNGGAPPSLAAAALAGLGWAALQPARRWAGRGGRGRCGGGQRTLCISTLPQHSFHQLLALPPAHGHAHRLLALPPARPCAAEPLPAHPCIPPPQSPFLSLGGASSLGDLLTPGSLLTPLLCATHSPPPHACTTTTPSLPRAPHPPPACSATSSPRTYFSLPAQPMPC